MNKIPAIPPNSEFFLIIDKQVDGGAPVGTVMFRWCHADDYCHNVAWLRLSPLPMDKYMIKIISAVAIMEWKAVRRRWSEIEAALQAWREWGGWTELKEGIK